MKHYYYEELHHTADWAIHVWGNDINQLFQHAAAAMFHLQGADLEKTPTVSTEVTCQAADLEALLIAWLSELLYLSELNNALYTRFQVQLTRQEVGESDHTEWTLWAQVQGLSGRGPLAHIKAATYYQLRIQQSEDRWDAVVTFDT